MATTSRENDRRCGFPLGCGFCGSPKRVEQSQRTPSLLAGGRTRVHKLVGADERSSAQGGTVPRRTPWGVVVWLRPECTVPSSGRHGRRQLGPERRGEGETRRTVSLAGPGEPRTVHVSRSPGTLCLSLLTYGHGGPAPALLLVPSRARHSLAVQPTSHDAHAIEVMRAVIQQHQGNSPGSGSHDRGWPLLLHLLIDTVKIWGYTSHTVRVLAGSSMASVTTFFHFGWPC